MGILPVINPFAVWQARCYLTLSRLCHVVVPTQLLFDIARRDIPQPFLFIGLGFVFDFG